MVDKNGAYGILRHDVGKAELENMWQAIQRRAAQAVTAVAIVALFVGCALYLFALRPCSIELNPGTYVSYRLTTDIQPVDREKEPTGSVSSHQQTVDLLCYSGANDVALIAPGADDLSEVTLVRLAPDGRAQRYDDSDRLLGDGKALGFFDFNLLPLPQGMQQNWNVTLTYAALPVGRRQVEGHVQRIGGGAHPRFELALPTVEWVESHPSEHYRQVRELVCRYTYNGVKRVIESAELSFVAVVERPSGPERFAVRCYLDLVDYQEHDEDPVALRDMIVGAVEAQAVRERDDHQRLQQVLARLRQYDVRNPALREFVYSLQTNGRAQGERGSVLDKTADCPKLPAKQKPGSFR